MSIDDLRSLPNHYGCKDPPVTGQGCLCRLLPSLRFPEPVILSLDTHEFFAEVLPVNAARSRFLAFFVAFALLVAAQPAFAQGSTEERFHDLFVTAGYSTAFGAALGTAFLAFKEDPTANLQFVAIGASLGFIGGSILGSYVIFSPMISEQEGAPSGTLLTGGPMPDRGLVIRPSYNRETRSVTSVEGGLTLATF